MNDVLNGSNDVLNGSNYEFKTGTFEKLRVCRPNTVPTPIQDGRPELTAYIQYGASFEFCVRWCVAPQRAGFIFTHWTIKDFDSICLTVLLRLFIDFATGTHTATLQRENVFWNLF